MRKLPLLLGPVLFVITVFSFSSYGSLSVMAGLTLWMAVWWLTEVVDLAVTALLPVVLFPLFGVMKASEVATQYIDQIIFLFIGGFLLAFALEKSGLHHRMALYILARAGQKPLHLLAGVMTGTFFISMWISNTASVMVLLPAVLGVINEVEKDIADDEKRKKFSTAILLGLAYSASIGGMATLVGTPTNMIFASFYHKTTGLEISFFQWFKIAFPVALATLLAGILILRFLFLRSPVGTMTDVTAIKERVKQQGRLSRVEKVVAATFAVTVILWFFRADIDLGAVVLPGWQNIFSHKEYFHDSTVAMTMALILFVVPVKDKKAILSWEDLRKLPLNIILLFGGGFALAKGFEVSGLTNAVGVQVKSLGTFPPLLIVLFLCTIVTVISEFASNVASIQLVLPLAAGITATVAESPLAVLVASTLAASLGFMLPVATAPNTIVYSSNRVSSKDMMLAGLFFDAAGILAITVITLLQL